MGYGRMTLIGNMRTRIASIILKIAGGWMFRNQSYFDVNRPGVWPRAIASRSEGVPVLARQAAVQDRFFDCDVNREEARLQAKLYRVPYMNLIRNILMPTVSWKNLDHGKCGTSSRTKQLSLASLDASHAPYPSISGLFTFGSAFFRKDAAQAAVQVHAVPRVRRPWGPQITAFHPAGPFKTCWNMLVAVCVLHDLVIIPVHFGQWWGACGWKVHRQ